MKALEFGRSYLIYTSKAFALDTTTWVGPVVAAVTILPASKFQGKVRN